MRGSTATLEQRSERTKQTGAAKAKSAEAKPRAAKTLKLVAGEAAPKRTKTKVEAPFALAEVESLAAHVRKPVAVEVTVRAEVRSSSMRSGNGTGAAVALQRSPEPVIEFDSALDAEEDLDDDFDGGDTPVEGTSLGTKALHQTHPFEAFNSADYDPQAEMSPEQRRAMRDQVVIEHLPLARAIAVRVHENLPVHVELDDLIHAGIMGLFDASSKYNPEKKVAFSSYAKHRIKGAILDSLRQLDWASRDLRRRHKQIEQATRDLASTLHRNPTEEEVAGKMGVEVDRWRQMMLDLRNVGLISASTRGTEHDDLPAPDFPAKAESQPDSMCAYEQLKGVLATAMQVLPERYKKVVLMYYKNELTMKEIGLHLGINESRVSQIHKSALEKMANALQQAGIGSSQAF